MKSSFQWNEIDGVSCANWTHHYHRLALPFPVSVDCPSVVGAVTDNGDVAVAAVDNDDFDRLRSYKYVRA